MKEPDGLHFIKNARLEDHLRAMLEETVEYIKFGQELKSEMWAYRLSKVVNFYSLTDILLLT